MLRILLSLCFIFIWVFGTDIVSAAIPVGTKISPCNNKTYYGKIQELWISRKPTYLKLVEDSRENPYGLYNIQSETNNLFKYAKHCHDYFILHELMALYLKAIETLDESDQYVFSYYPNSPIRSIHKLDKKYKMWLDGGFEVGREGVLVSAQFLMLVSEVVGYISGIDSVNKTPLMRLFVRKYLPILKDHYTRWVFNSMGSFQVRGWGCKLGGEYVDSVMNHQEFIKNKLKKLLGDRNEPSYCNAVSDTDLWIISGVSNLLSTSRKNSQGTILTLKEYNKFSSYLSIGLSLISSRIREVDLLNFNGQQVKGADFDVGAWDDHYTYQYAGVSNYGINHINHLTKKDPGIRVGWDLSHARRFVHVFESLYRNKDIVDMKFPSKIVMERFSNQLLYKVFNRSFKLPLFSNFMDGSNGWFRVGYRERKGFGYAPWDMSISIMTGGYGFWYLYNKDIGRLFKAIVEMLSSNKYDIRQHVITHYEENVWVNYKRESYINFFDKENIYTQSILMQLIPSLCYMPMKDIQPIFNINKTSLVKTIK